MAKSPTTTKAKATPAKKPAAAPVAANGLVTDFILLRAGPLHTGIFNLADLAIVFGLIILFASLQMRQPSTPS